MLCLGWAFLLPEILEHRRLNADVCIKMCLVSLGLEI